MMTNLILLLLFSSRSVMAPSPNNPIDPAATPCDLKTVIVVTYEGIYSKHDIYIKDSL